MITLINTTNFTHQESVIYAGNVHHSVYCHNYYTSEDGEIILEDSDDDCSMAYYRVDPITGSHEYLGFVMTHCSGIFFNDYDGHVSRDENGIIELDNELY